MKHTIRLLFFLTFMMLAAMAAYLYVFSVPGTVQLNVSQGGSQKDSLQCYNNAAAEPINHNTELNVLVWNIFKQDNANWRETLQAYSQNTNLALLQEVSMTDEFKAYTKDSNWFSSHVDAFSAFGVSTGVLTLSVQSPLLACAHIQVEPWLLLPKSGIYAVFRLSDARELAVVNLHSVNFTYGTQEYEKQIKALSKTLKKHKGPVIFAGDLNAWSLERFAAIESTLKQLGLTEVAFKPDNRTQFINGMALDYVFYRDLKLISAMSPFSDASDHNPLLVKFSL